MSDLSAEFLLMDVGNTNVKLRLATRRRLLGSTRRLPTATLLHPLLHPQASQAMQQTLEGWRFKRVVLATVVPAAAAAVALWLGDGILHVASSLDIGVDLRGYPGRRTLGADRLADLAGAMALHGPGPLIVVDLGTAAVFNAVAADGAFLGGVIAPGLAALHGSLPAHTAQLPSVKLRHPRRPIGRTTSEALLAGTIYGYRGMLREILAALRQELTNARVIATGGDVRLLEGQLHAGDVVNPDLTLQGLRIIAARQQGKRGLRGKIRPL